MTTTKIDTTPHVTLPTAPRPPDRVIEELRKVDPRAELVYWGEGAWLLGVVADSPERCRRGRQMLQANRKLGIGDRSERQFKRIALSRLAAQGFGYVALYEFEGDARPDLMKIVDDFRRRDFHYRNHFEEMKETHSREIDGRAQEKRATATLLEAAEAKASDIVSKVFRHAKSFRQKARLPFHSEETTMGEKDGNLPGPGAAGGEDEAPSHEELEEARMEHEGHNPNTFGEAVTGDVEDDDEEG